MLNSYVSEAHEIPAKWRNYLLTLKKITLLWVCVYLKFFLIFPSNIILWKRRSVLWSVGQTRRLLKYHLAPYEPLTQLDISNWWLQNILVWITSLFADCSQPKMLQKKKKWLEMSVHQQFLYRAKLGHFGKYNIIYSFWQIEDPCLQFCYYMSD